MPFALLFILIFSEVSFAHGEHGNEMKTLQPSSTSILQLESKWKNQRSEIVNLSDLRGKPQLLVMLFTRCETACPLIVEDLKEIVKDLGSVGVSIFSLDSFRETPKSLSAFSVKRKLPSDWGLFVSNGDAVAELAAALGVRYKRLKNGDFIHSNVIYFLNSEGEVVAKKEGIKTPRSEFIKQVRKSLDH